MTFSTVLLAAVLATNAIGKIENPAKITSDTTYYDRREGFVAFKGHVHVDDTEYQMHAEQGYLFLSATNSLKRIVLVGDVALTNGTKRAYGEKVTYRQETGLVVLHGGAKRIAEVREVMDSGDRIVRGRKIRFWINREQVEVLEADITAPRTGLDGHMPAFGR